MSPRPSLVVALVPLALAACITDPVTGKSVLGMPTSTEEENSQGLAYRPQITQDYGGPYPDGQAQEYLGGIVLGMAGRSVRPELNWQFTMLNSSVPNAFAVPGGQVFVTRGLLWRMDDEAEFASVMGHEIGHVEHRHSAQSMVRDTGTAVLAGLAGEAIGSAELGSVAGTLFVQKFSRDQERESDERGVRNAYQNGYDPREGADVFRKFLRMKQEQGQQESAIENWFSSHPLDTERIEEIGRLCGEIDPRLAGTAPVADLRVQTDRFAEMVARLRGEQKVYDRLDAAFARVQQAGGTAQAVRAALPEFDACARALPDHAFLASKAGLAHLAAGDQRTGREWLERACAMGQDLHEPEYLLATVTLQGGDHAAAIEHAGRGLAILPSSWQCLFVRGEALWRSGRQAEARRDFEQVVQAAPRESAEFAGAAARLQGTQPPGRRRKNR